MTTDLDAIDLGSLARWMDQHTPHLGHGPVRARLVSGGSTNLVVGLERDGGHCILRSPPLAGSPQGEKTIEREATVLRALKGTAVPHPAFHAFCAERSVIGVPFYLMAQVDGWAATITHENVSLYPPRFADGPDQHYLGYAMVDGLAAMANLDWRAAGLAGYGKPEGFLARQVDRWLGQLATYPKKYPAYTPRALPGLAYVEDWLRANVPDTWRPGLMHGDYALNNVLFAHRPPARLVAIIDWETSTIGDPVLDLAAFAMSLRSEGEPAGNWSYFDPARFPRREDVVAYYAELTGSDVSRMDFYYVLYRFRMACILEYKVAEAVQGLAPKAKGERFAAMVLRLLGDAEQLARSRG
jgi:aminoglycoside phosphotransferase (APT) family kinase protein